MGNPAIPHQLLVAVQNRLVIKYPVWAKPNTDPHVLLVSQARLIVEQALNAMNSSAGGKKIAAGTAKALRRQLVELQHQVRART